MKRIILSSLFILSLMGHNYVHAHDDLIDYINIRHVPHGGTHNNLPLPADMPDVYYDNSNQQIIVDGLGVVTYYDVEIASATNWTVYISTQVSGSYGTIDISSLPEGEYVITIDSPLDNTYEGYFETY